MTIGIAEVLKLVGLNWVDLTNPSRLQEVDTVNRLVQLRFTDSRLDWCEGRLPTLDGPIALRWRKEGGKLIYQVSAPAGYAVKTDNRSSLESSATALTRLPQSGLGGRFFRKQVRGFASKFEEANRRAGQMGL